MALATSAIFTPLYASDERGACYLLQLGDFKILLDCGWGGSFDLSTVHPLLDIAQDIDAILISHPDIAHLGALPYLIGKLGVTAPIYATSAIQKMGQMYMYDAYLTRQAVSDFTAFDLDDVDAAFGKVNSVRYRQEVVLSGRGQGITLTAFPAGHLLGGSIWRISRGGEDHVYAVDFNHKRERHLVGTALESMFSRPAVLIAGSSVDSQRSGDAVERELLDLLMYTLRADGNVLIPIDAAGRVLELILLLEKHWGEYKLTYPLVFLCPMAHTTLEFARSNLEFMNETLAKSFGHTRDNPYNLKYVKPCASKADLDRYPPGPRVVLTTSASLEAGHARDLFVEWAVDPRNSVILPLWPEQGSLAENVLSLAAQRDSQGPGTAPPLVTIELSRREPLQGEELQQYLDAQEEERQREAEAQENMMEVDAGGASPRSTKAASEFGTAGGVQHPKRESTSAIKHVRLGGVVEAADGDDDALIGGATTAANEACLIEGFEVPAGAAAPMFPFEDEWEQVVYDEYGAVKDLTELEADAGAARQTLFDGEEADTLLDDTDAPIDDEATAALAKDVPTKVVHETINLGLRCKVTRLDFDGMSDVRSVRTLLAHVAPRACFIVRSKLEISTKIADYLSRELEGLNAAVHIPQPGVAIQVEDGTSYQVALGDGIGMPSDMHAVGEYSLAWVNGIVQGQSEDGLPLVVAPPSIAAGLQGGSGAGGVFIGDIKLSDVRKALAAVGIASEFHGGDLYCQGKVIVKRRGQGDGLVVEGLLGEGYYKIRDIVYAQYHIA